MNVGDIFNQFAQEYDETRRQFIPCFDDFYGTAIRLIPFKPDNEISVVDLGAGTGLLSQFILSTYSKAHVRLIDIAEKMLEQAKIRLKSFGNQCVFQVVDYVKEKITSKAEKFDVIMSSLSIHHLTRIEKEKLFGKIFHALKPGGIFINADQVLGDSPVIEAIYRQDWLDRITQTTLTSDDVAAALIRVKADKMDRLADQLDCLKDVGYTNVNCWYSNYSFVVYSGMK
jgi:tRNA (cmo5U34)-methyltransferase